MRHGEPGAVPDESRAKPLDLNRARQRDLEHARLPPESLKILQITDTHLYADADGRLLGVNTLDSFHAVIDAFLDTGWKPDLILCTGDLVHDASPEGYRKLGALLDRFGVPVCCLPGNHDNPPVMHEYLRGEHVSCPRVVDAKGWRLVLLDSVIPGEVGGRLEAGELEALARALDGNTRPTLISLHHQPVPVGSAWLDGMGLENAAALEGLLAGHPEVKGLLWGHVHQQFDEVRNGIRLMASPSTCIQFAPHSDDFSVGQQQPGFRLLALMPDGQILTEVMRTTRIPQGLELASAGYE